MQPNGVPEIYEVLCTYAVKDLHMFELKIEMEFNKMHNLSDGVPLSDAFVGIADLIISENDLFVL